jgi:hypothetical protein
MRCNSWIIISKQTGKAVAELYRRDLVALVNRERYEVKCAYEYLTALNRQIKAA